MKVKVKVKGLGKDEVYEQELDIENPALVNVDVTVSENLVVDKVDVGVPVEPAKPKKSFAQVMSKTWRGNNAEKKNESS